MELTYEKMLDRAYLSVPKKALEHERFEIPKADSMLQGSKTIVRGFNNLLKDMRREEKHFLKYLTKETATSVTKVNNQLIINGKVNSYNLNKLIEAYFRQFVLCPVCGKPDTNIINQSGAKMMKCEACGAINPVRGL